MSEEKDREQYGVLLYYNYAEIPDLNHLLTFYRSNCSSLNLLGRVRLSSHGVNVTVSNHLYYSFFFSFLFQFVSLRISLCTGWWQPILSWVPHRSPQSLQLLVSQHWFQARHVSSPTKRQSCPGEWFHFSLYSDCGWTCYS